MSLFDNYIIGMFVFVSAGKNRKKSRIRARSPSLILKRMRCGLYEVLFSITGMSLRGFPIENFAGGEREIFVRQTENRLA